MIRFLAPLLLATGLAATTTALAQADYQPLTLTFNDLAATGPGGNQLPAGYGGFDFGARGPTFYITRPAPSGSPTDNYLAFSASSSFSYFRSDRSAFYLDGVDFFSRRAADAVGDVHFVLYRNGTTVYNGLLDKDGRNVFTGTAATFRPMVFDEDTHASAPYGGLIDGFALAFDNDDYDHLAMDNLQLRVLAAVPEPQIAVLLLTGLALLGRIARRRPAVAG